MSQTLVGGQRVNYRLSIGSVWAGRRPYPSQDYSIRHFVGKKGNSDYVLDVLNTPFHTTTDPLDLETSANNKAYAKFKQRAFESASLGIALAERKQACNMIATRAGQLVQLVRRAKRGGFLNSVGHVSIRKPHNESKNDYLKRLSNWWLEFHFGWEPLYKDIFDSINVLQSAYPKGKRVYGGGQALGYYKANFPPVQYATSFNTYRVIYSAKVNHTNPMLFRASQLGLLNPAALAWELLPFSFLVDWFYPVGNFLNEATDWVGVDLQDPQKARKNVKANCDVWYANPGYPSYSWQGNYVYFTRQLYALPSRFLPKEIDGGFGTARAATAIALLLQAFDPRKQAFSVPYGKQFQSLFNK